ncbi:hypothetical protein LZ32DRAFT_423446 [Colletotrichum eremochloae]|nr:hypothetical protein LZ32DRAFT_423446 [Colletotrichum eremochloae]
MLPDTVRAMNNISSDEVLEQQDEPSTTMPERSTLSECACLSSSVGRLLTWTCIMLPSFAGAVRYGSLILTPLVQLHGHGCSGTDNTGEHIKSHPAAAKSQERLGGGVQVYLASAECTCWSCLYTIEALVLTMPYPSLQQRPIPAARHRPWHHPSIRSENPAPLGPWRCLAWVVA